MEDSDQEFENNGGEALNLGEDFSDEDPDEEEENLEQEEEDEEELNHM